MTTSLKAPDAADAGQIEFEGRWRSNSVAAYICLNVFSVGPMSVFWLSYRVNNRRCVVIQPAISLVGARMKSALSVVDDHGFRDGHELDEKTAKRIPKEMIGRCLTMAEAIGLLERLAA
jgi:hypothetical protein